MTCLITMLTSTIPKNWKFMFIIRCAMPMISTESDNPYVQINEIITTGKLSKLEHFENDEKVMDKVVHDLDIFNYLCHFLEKKEGAKPFLVVYLKNKKYVQRKMHNYNKESAQSLN